MSHMPPAMAIIALDLVLVIPPWSEFEYFRLHHCFGHHFAIGISGCWYWYFDCSFSDLDWIPVMGFSSVCFEPY